ncbi:MAG: hypothetical protein A3B47_04625 [Candidatus Levybacteria bacterium RIFCSPLOWO2_01_FULL_39_24]|nr:MAG: hypothetical protein A2800_03995 [Candidatus Levybacteria bacterium RIFCSPHIGHO2_01_FULL_40_16]OGH28039.1 MAG: hypothetical protein A3E12_01530 [Candidatus Levybacteria bacterium RIFCSPHIGHO2_12_FULL_39_9]OGH46729.1 MAG: hypothetical protein A3B47_04625 [Candidatus Levybacteria bacterium RIFCSPLOWO2_01_FULL_39_24]
MVVDKYIYLLLSILLLLIWSVFFLFLKKEVRRILIKASVVGGLAGLIAEFWYFKDYWRPPLLFGDAKIFLEDFLFGFAFTGIAATIYKVLFKKEGSKHEKGHRIIFFVFFVIGILSLLLFNNLLKINSIFVSSFVFLILSFMMVFIRKDLVMQSIMSGILSLSVIIPIYILLFNFISPGYWDKYWLLANTAFGIKIIGNIPVTELLWYFSWSCLAGIAYDFYHGNKGEA